MTRFRKAFIARTKEARLAVFDAQADIAALLGTVQSTYKQWETRNPLPHELIPTFCKLCNVSITWLFTGRSTLVLLLALLAAAPAHAQNILEPPPPYDEPYTGWLNVVIVPRDEVNAKCKELSNGFSSLRNYGIGCAFVAAPRSFCTIVIPEIGPNVTADLQAAVNRHELGHCNGWRH